MGTDIRLHVEVKIKNTWHCYGSPSVSRDYQLFSVLAGVRGDEDPIARPRGLPPDVSEVVRVDAILREGHSASWLNAKEIGLLRERMQVLQPGRDLEHDILSCYLFGNSLDGFTRFPNDMKRLRRLGVEDVRLVFWFDC